MVEVRSWEASVTPLWVSHSQCSCVCAADLSKPNEVSGLAVHAEAELGPVGILVNNAGMWVQRVSGVPLFATLCLFPCFRRDSACGECG
jgi:NAD(P)-dependent dehydrogenase (short-subunit alcohol dehydrogenase family)